VKNPSAQLLSTHLPSKYQTHSTRLTGSGWFDLEPLLNQTHFIMAIKGKSKSKRNLEARDKEAARKITMIVTGVTLALVLLLYLMFSNV